MSWQRLMESHHLGKALSDVDTWGLLSVWLCRGLTDKRSRNSVRSQSEPTAREALDSHSTDLTTAALALGARLPSG